MNRQIIHDSIHYRPGWTREFALDVDGQAVGYGSLAIAGPWKSDPSLYEWYVIPEARTRMFDLFDALLDASGAGRLEIQSNDPLICPLFFAWARDVETESILFADGGKTAWAPAGATFRQAAAEEAPGTTDDQLRWRGVVEWDGVVAGRGGVLFHYNEPYGDIYMDVDEPFRRHGVGSYLVQELKRWCYERGVVPGARCNPANTASRRTLQKAGFVPCGHLLVGRVAR